MVIGSVANCSTRIDCKRVSKCTILRLRLDWLQIAQLDRLTRPPIRKSDIMFGNDRFHGQRGVHPHRNLEAGHTTLNAEMGKLLARSLVEKGEFDKDDYLAKYIEYMLSRQVFRDSV